MALASLLGQKRGPTIGGIQVDVSIRETHSSSREVSDSPIELGSDVSDHSKRMPDELSLDGILSNLPSSIRGRVELANTGNTAEKRYAELLELADNAETFEVVTGLRVYRNMVFTSIAVDRDNSTGESIRFRATMRELEFAQSETVAVEPNEADSGKPEPTTDRGQKPKKPAPEAASNTARSSLSRFSGGTTGADRTAGFLGGLLQ